MTERRPIALITGASAGIGEALARIFAKNGHELVLIARREQKLAQIADDIATLGYRRPDCLPLDLSRRDAVEQIAGAMSSLGVEPAIVVNNAGFGLLGPAVELSRAEQLTMIDLNIRVLVDLSLAFIASLERHRGGILNVASVAAFLPGPYMADYYATKAYILSFSEALHWELRQRGVRVTTLCPGPVPTEFQARAGFDADPSPDMLSQSAEAVAAAGYRGLLRGKRVVVPGLLNRLAVAIVRIMPRSLLMASVSRYNRQRLPHS